MNQSKDLAVGGNICLVYSLKLFSSVFFKAVIHEAQRVANTVPLSVFHCTTANTELNGYSIPKVRIKTHEKKNLDLDILDDCLTCMAKLSVFHFLPHCVTFSTQGTMIIPNLSSVLNEEKHWKFPHEFNPENFLNEKGEFVKVDAFIPFSAGM